MVGFKVVVIPLNEQSCGATVVALATEPVAMRAPPTIDSTAPKAASHANDALMNRCMVLCPFRLELPYLFLACLLLRGVTLVSSPAVE